MKAVLAGLAEVVGVALVVVGLGLWSVELALIALGAVLVFAGVRWST